MDTNQINKKYMRLFYRIISIILIGAFVSYDLAWAYPEDRGTLAVTGLKGLQGRDTGELIKAVTIVKFIEKKIGEISAAGKPTLNDISRLSIIYPDIFEGVTKGEIALSSKVVDLMFYLSKEDGHIAVRYFDAGNLLYGGRDARTDYEEIAQSVPIFPDSTIHRQVLRKKASVAVAVRQPESVIVLPPVTAAGARVKSKRSVSERILQTASSVGEWWYNKKRKMGLNKDEVEERTALRISWWLEDLPKVGLPFGVFAILNTVSAGDSSLNVHIFSAMVIIFGTIFFIRHLLNDRAPPEDIEEGMALYAAPALAAISSIAVSIASVTFIANPLAQFLVALPASIAAHLAINLTVKALRGRGIDAGYASISNGDDTKWMSSFDRNKTEWSISDLRTVSLKKLKLSLYAVGALVVLGAEIAVAAQSPILGSWLIFLTVALQASMYFREWRAISDLQNRAFAVLRNMQLRFDTFKDEMWMRDISKLELEAIDRIFGWDCYKYRLSKKDGKLYYVYDRGTLVDSSYADNPRQPTDKDEKEYFWSNMARYHSEVNPITKRAIVEQLQREYPGWIVGPNGELKGLYIRDRSKLPHGYSAKNIDVDRKKYGEDVNQMLFWAEEEGDDIVGYAFIDWRSYRKFISLKNLSDSQLDKLRDRLIAAQDVGDVFGDHYLYRLHKDFTLQGIAKEGALNDSSYTKDPRVSNDHDEKHYVCQGLADYWWGPGRIGRPGRAQELKKGYPGWIVGPNGELLGLYIKDRRKLPPGYQANNLRSDERAYGNDVNQMLFWARMENDGLMLYLCVDWIDQRRTKDFVSLKNVSPKRLSTISDIITLLGNTVRYEKKNLEARLHTERMAIKDGLTGLYNHSYFKAAINQEIGRTRTQRGNRSLAIIMIDLDHFKNVNDGYGHEAGNRVLKQVADTVMKNLRSGDVPCRYGGEELAVILPDTSEKDAAKMAERLKKAVETAVFTDDNGKPIPKTAPGSGEPMGTISLGVSAVTKKAASRENFTAEDLIADADKALYRSKEGGRNRVTVYSDIAASNGEDKDDGLPAVFGMSAASATGIGILIMFGVLIAHEVTRQIYELRKSQGLISDNRFMRAILQRSLWPMAARQFIFKYISEPIAKLAVRLTTRFETSTFHLEKDISRISERVESLRKHLAPPVTAAFSDVHGELYRLDQAIERAERMYGAKRFIFLGDAIDVRNDHSGTIEKRREKGEVISARKTMQLIKSFVEGGKGEYILGNHDICLIGSVLGPAENDRTPEKEALNRALFLQWVLPEHHFGGHETLKEFGIRSTFTFETANDFSCWMQTGNVKTKFDSEAQKLYTKAKKNKGLIELAEWLKEKGRLYLIEDETLYVHGGIPVYSDGEMCPMVNRLTGRAALEQLERDFREGFISYTDLVFSEKSPLNADSPSRRNPWYGLIRSDRSVRHMQKAFGVKRFAFGHSPFSPPMMFGGKLVNLDGGLSDMYEGRSRALIMTDRGVILQLIFFEGRHNRVRKEPGDIVVEEFRAPRINKDTARQIKGLEDILAIKKKRMEALVRKMSKTIAKRDTDFLPPVKPKKNGNGDNGTPDGFIRKGQRSARTFSSITDDIRLCSGTREYDERAVGLLEGVLAKARLSDAERSAMQARLQKIADGSFKIFEFLPIVTARDDFFLGWSNVEDDELFLAPELIKYLGSRGPPTLVDEYLLHELLCPIAGHYRAVLIQQQFYPGHYDSRKDLLSRQTAENPYKGILNTALSDFIKERLAAAAGLKPLSMHDANTRKLRHIVGAAGRRDRAFRIIRHKIRNGEMPDLRISDLVKLSALGGMYLDVSADVLQWWDGLSPGKKADVPADLGNIAEPSYEEQRDTLFGELEIDALLDRLEEKDREIARMYMGGHTLMEIGARFGFVKERARQRLVEISRELIEITESGLSRRERKEARRERVRVSRQQRDDMAAYIKARLRETRRMMGRRKADLEDILSALQELLYMSKAEGLSESIINRLVRYGDKLRERIKEKDEKQREKAERAREGAEKKAREKVERARGRAEKAKERKARKELAAAQREAARMAQAEKREAEPDEEKLARRLHDENVTAQRKGDIAKKLAVMGRRGNLRALELLGIAALEIHEMRITIVDILCQLPPEIVYGKMPVKIHKIWYDALSGEGKERVVNILRKRGRDGYIRQGTEAVKDFEPQIPMIRQNNLTAKYCQRATALLEKILAADGIAAEERDTLEAQLKKFRDGSYKIYGFKSIVKNKDDFLLGWNNVAGSELFLAIDVIAELEARGPPTLVDEYLMHELLCPALGVYPVGHYKAILLQQKLFPEHYPDKDKISQQSAEHPYKGILGSMLRLSIDKMKDPILAKIIHDIKDHVATSGGFAQSENKRLKKRFLELLTSLKERVVANDIPDLDVSRIKAMLADFYTTLDDYERLIREHDERKEPSEAEIKALKEAKDCMDMLESLEKAQSAKGMTILKEESELKDLMTAILKLQQYQRLSMLFCVVTKQCLRGDITVEETLDALKKNLPEFIRLKAVLKQMRQDEAPFKDARFVSSFDGIIQANDEAIVDINSAIRWLGRSMERFSIEEVKKMVDQAAQRFPNIKFNCILSGEVLGLTDIFTYKRILKTVLEGLIDNAQKYSGTGSIDVTVSLTKDLELKVEVRDRGKGMSEERQKTIFMPGFSEAKMRKVGTGFGLYTYKESVEATGGSMSFISKAGEGTVFLFTLPINAPLDIFKKPSNGPLIVVVSGLMGSGRRAVSRVLASRLGLRYINGGFVAKVLVAKMLEERIDVNDETRVAVYAREFLLEKKRLDYSHEPVTIDGIDTTTSNERGLSVRDEIKRTFEDSRANEEILHRVTKYHGVRQAIREFYEQEARRVKSSGQYNGFIIRTSEPIMDVAQKEFFVENIMLLASSRVRAERVRRSRNDIDALDASTGKANFGAQYSGVKKISTSYRAVADICREALDHIKLAISPADMFLRRGSESLMEFETLIVNVRRNGISDSLRERLEAIINSALKTEALTSGEAARLFSLAKDIKNGGYAVRGFDSIVKARDDFFLGWNDKDERELFVATNIVDKMDSIGWPSLADEYMFRALFCPVVGRARSLELQQGLWPAHYPDKELLKAQTIEKPYDGILGETLKNIVSSEELTRHPYTRIESEGIDLSRAVFTVEDAVNEALSLCVANGQGKFNTSRKEKLYAVLIRTLLALEDPSTHFELKHIETIKTLLEQIPQTMVKIDFVLPHLEEYVREGDAEDLRMQLATVHERIMKAYQDILSACLYMRITHLFRNSLVTIGGFARSLGKRYPNDEIKRFIEALAGMEMELNALADQEGKFNTVENLASFLRDLEKSVGSERVCLETFARENMPSFSETARQDIDIIRQELETLNAENKEVSLAARSNIGLEQLIEKAELAITKIKLGKPLPAYMRVVAMVPGSDELVKVAKGTPVKVRVQVYVEGYEPQKLGKVGAKEFSETVLKARALTDALSPVDTPPKEAWKAVEMRFIGTGGTEDHDYIFEATIPTDRYASVADKDGRMSEFKIMPQVAIRLEDPQAQERWFNCENLNIDPLKNQHGDARLIVLPEEAPAVEKAAPAPTHKEPEEAPSAAVEAPTSGDMSVSEALDLAGSIHEIGIKIVGDVVSRKVALNGNGSMNINGLKNDNGLTNGTPRSIPVNVDIFADIPEANSDILARFLEILALKQLYMNKRSKGTEFELVSLSNNTALLAKVEKMYGELDVVRKYDLKLHKDNGLQRGFAISALGDDTALEKDRCIFLEKRIMALDEGSGLCMWAGVLDLALAMTMLLDQDELSRKDHYSRLAEFYNKLLADRPEAVESDILAMFFDDDVQRAREIAKKLAIPLAGKFNINDLRELYIKMRTVEEAA